MAKPPAGRQPGVLALVVGPSGAGKDTLIGYARTALADDPRFVFVRRAVTRAPGPGEEHDPLSREAFAAASAAGELALVWSAHGLDYGLPRASLELTHRGRVGVANVSRGVIAAARRLAPRVAVLHVTAAPEVLAARLAARGREDVADIARRLAREAAPLAGADVIEIRNDTTVEAAGERFLAALRRIAE